MNIFEIDKAIMGCIDEETGEFNEDLYNELQMEREQKIDNTCRVYKWYGVLQDGIEEEIIKLKERLANIERQKDRLSDLIAYAVGEGNKYETPSAKISWRKSSSVEITDEWAIPDEFKVEKITKTISKTAIKDAIKGGIAVPGAYIKEAVKVQVK